MPLTSINYSIPYLIFFFVIYLFSFPVTGTTLSDVLVDCKENKANKIFMFYAALLFSLYFIGLRGYIFTDWHSYKEYFDYSPDLFADDIIRFVKQSVYEKGYTI